MYTPITIYELQEDSLKYKKGHRFFVLFQSPQLSERTVLEDGSVSFCNREFMNIPLELRKKFFAKVPTVRFVYVQKQDTFMAKAGTEWYVFPDVDPNLLVRFNENETAFAETLAFSNDKSIIDEWFEEKGSQTEEITSDDPFESILFYDPSNVPVIPGTEEEAPQA